MFDIDKSCLLIVDVQGKLAHRVYNSKQIIANIQSLIQAAHILQVPVILTEQAPDKIGVTIPEISKLLTAKSIEKTAFSCCAENAFKEELSRLNRKQIIICGIETHVCIYQTVFDLRYLNYQVQVVTNAVSSRNEEDKQVALERIRLTGATMTTTEMIITELLRTSKHPKFKEIMNLIK